MGLEAMMGMGSLWWLTQAPQAHAAMMSTSRDQTLMPSSKC
ncbi:unnamed protein product [Brassica rapa subsp. narinosa]